MIPETEQDVIALSDISDEETEDLTLKFICADCDNEIEGIPEHENPDGGPICESCDEEYFECADCSDRINEQEHMNADGDWICEVCREDYFVCEECSATVSNSDMCEVDGTVMCDTCRDEHYVQCHSCDDWVRRDDSYSHSWNYYCSWCYDDTFRECDECGDTFNRDAMHYDADASSHLCEYCYDHRRSSRLLQSCNYRPNYIVYRVPGENGEAWLLGVEVEVDKASISNELLEDLKREELYFKEDGSLNSGFEVVSHPCSLEYHKTAMCWPDTFKLLVMAGFRAHNTTTCGLHIHVPRRRFTQIEQMKLATFVYNHHFQLTQLARRTNCSYAKFKKMNRGHEIREATQYDNIDRYEAVNFTNRRTIEFRLWKGTLKYSTFMATLELTQAICEFIKQAGVGSLIMPHASWQEFLKYVSSDCRYRAANAYIEKRLPKDTQETDESKEAISCVS